MLRTRLTLVLFFRSLGVACLLTGIVSCMNGPEKRNYHHYLQDFEGFDGWENPYAANLVKGNAWSGNYFFRMTSHTERSPVFKMPLTRLRDWPMGFMDAAVRVNSEKALPGSFLVMEVTDTVQHQSLLRQRVGFEGFFRKPGEWYQAKDRIKFPEGITDGCLLFVYVWNESNNEFGIDDLEIEFSTF